MSTGSESNEHKILAEPYKSVGAQDLIKISYNYCGHLRKRGRKERLFGSTRWGRKFVILSQGCVYCYKDELAEKPLSAFSLKIYDRVKEADFINAVHCFEVFHEDQTKPSHVFACETKERRKTWMEHINEAIVQAHLFSGEKLSADSDEGIVVSRPPKSRKPHIPAPAPPTQSPPVPEKPIVKKYKPAKSEYDFESTDEDDPYDEVDPKIQTLTVNPSPTQPRIKPPAGAQPVFPMGNRPVIPHKRQSVSERKPIALPTIPSVTSKNRSVSTSCVTGTGSSSTGGAEETMENYINLFPEEEYLLDSCDRTETNNALSHRTEGTFLIRNSNKGGQVLVVQTAAGIKSFQITQENGKVTLDRSKYFPCIGAMLCFYNKNLLPKSDYKAKLLYGYLH